MELPFVMPKKENSFASSASAQGIPENIRKKRRKPQTEMTRMGMDGRLIFGVQTDVIGGGALPSNPKDGIV
jgi:hypothetical protein